MEDSRNMKAQTPAENMGDEADMQGAAEGGKSSKLFTQEEVNSFVQARISRLRNQIAKETQAEFSQKLANLEAREIKLLIKEKLADRGMPKELAEIITCTSEEDISQKLDALQKIYGNPRTDKEKQTSGFTQIGTAFSKGDLPTVDPVRKAMGLE